MSNFKIGEKVVCIAINDVNVRSKEKTQHPKINSIVTISDIANDGWLSFEEMPSYVEYEYWNFRKLDYQFGEDVCAEILKKVKEESLILVN